MKELIEIQNKVRAPKNVENQHGHYMYRKAEQILEAVKPYLHEMNCTLIITDDIVGIGNNIYLKATATLTNAAGEKEEAVGWAREAQTLAAMSPGQITGATSSYARKYALCGLLAIDDSKDLDDESMAQTEKDVDLQQAIAEVNMCKSADEVKDIWNKWGKLKQNQEFIDAVTAVGTRLKGA